MRWFFALMIYRLLLPMFFLAAFPGWILKMLRRGGFGTRLGERVGVFGGGELQPVGAVHVHAVSVGETMLALKLIRAWRQRVPDQHFVLATGTATGHQVATSAALPCVRVTYAPLDFMWMVRCYLARFKPSSVVLIEGEAWPNFLRACRKRSIPVSLVNARMSPRSARRYQRFAVWLQPLFSLLDWVAIQQPDDAAIWQTLGVKSSNIYHTGSLKFDPSGGEIPVRRPEFQRILDALGRGRPVVMAASTHAGEEAWIASVVRTAVPHALPVVVPRHAERRMEVLAELERAGFTAMLRSQCDGLAVTGDDAVLVIDSTGELRDWTAHADVVVIGKSFRSTGGQNPSEAILAGKPVIFGPHMENFEPLATRLAAVGGGLRVSDRDQLATAIARALDPHDAKILAAHAREVLSTHDGATRKILDLLTSPPLKK